MYKRSIGIKRRSMELSGKPKTSTYGYMLYFEVVTVR